MEQEADADEEEYDEVSGDEDDHLSEPVLPGDHSSGHDSPNRLPVQKAAHHRERCLPQTEASAHPRLVGGQKKSKTVHNTFLLQG